MKDCDIKDIPRMEYSDFHKRGGKWLGAAREWIQRKFSNGESVTWGSNDVLGIVTVAQLEDLALSVAYATQEDINSNYHRVIHEQEFQKTINDLKTGKVEI